MIEAALTLEGWYALHDFRSLNWTAWTAADDEERAVAWKNYMLLCRNGALLRKLKKAAPQYTP